MNSEAALDLHYSAKPFLKFQTLWRLSDEEWIARRKEEWKQLKETTLSDFSAEELKFYSRFFVFGEEAEGYSKHNFRISYMMRLFLTPVTSEEDAKEVYYTIPPSERKNLVSEFLGQICAFGQSMPWLRLKVKAYVDAVFGNEYKRMQEPSTNSNEVFETSPKPTYFCEMYRMAFLKLVKGKAEYNYSVDMVKYFVSCLAHADDPNYRSGVKLDRLLAGVDKVIESADNYNDLVVEAAKNLKSKEQEILANWARHSHLDT